MATKKKTTVTRAQMGGDREKNPAVWITQLQNSVNYGIQDHGKLTAAAVRRAKEHFLAIKFFVEVELPEITALNETEKLRRSAAAAADKG